MIQFLSAKEMMIKYRHFTRREQDTFWLAVSGMSDKYLHLPPFLGDKQVLATMVRERDLASGGQQSIHRPARNEESVVARISTRLFQVTPPTRPGPARLFQVTHSAQVAPKSLVEVT